ncbi:DUF6268 family outer membrane beta-barrel protein [Winogradskyella psychrotolerans]|uniref:DUF6268 family outer membrane beta-barrel protein n=1 Tax=Winogradskyella psychrotolerans TaxID=1344585 RepID=UPI001C06C962|nr:DUF6268 family outer membrane beta-barrel protein [Winogradskyella psychrotolerans]MBU2929411.1 hypothetical protein [Winogradskyella psychrotolerans]
MRKNTLYYLTFSLVSMVSYGQKMFTTTDSGDLLALDYGNYLNLNDIQLEHKSVAMDFTSLLNSSTFGFGVDYTNHSLDFEDYDRFHDYSAFNELHSVELYARYKTNLVNNWDLNLTVAPYVSSTFNEAISTDDFVLNYAVNFLKTWDNDGLKSTLKLGAGYGSLFGAPNFYPLVSYSQNVSEKLRYEIGLPVTGVFYKLNAQSSLDFKAEPESIYANNVSGFRTETDGVVYNSKLEFKAVKLGLGYKFHFDDNWSTYFNMGYTMASELSLIDNDNTIYDFDSNESVALNIGISFNINKK